MSNKIFKLMSVVLAIAMLSGMVACQPAAPRVLKLCTTNHPMAPWEKPGRLLRHIRVEPSWNQDRV